MYPVPAKTFLFLPNRSNTMGEDAYTCTFPAAQTNSSFPSAPLPQSSFSSLPVPDSSGVSNPQPSIPPMDYPPILSSSPTLSSSSTTPLLQQTCFTFPTPPPSNSSSPQPLLSSSSPSSNTYHTIPETISPHTSTDTSFSAPAPTCPSNLQDQISTHALSTRPSQPLQGETISSENNSPSDQSSAVFIYPNILHPNHDPASVIGQPIPNQYQAPPPTLPCSLPSHGAPTSFAFPSIPAHMQNLSFPNVSPSSGHSAMHIPNLSHQAQAPSLSAPFPSSTFTHPSSSLPHPPYQPSSCLGVSSTFQQSVSSTPSLRPAAHPQNFPSASTSSSTTSFPPVEMGGVPQFHPPAPYRTDMVLHHPSLLPQLDPSLPSCIPSSTPPTALYPAFPSYPLRLVTQDPHSSLSIPFRHLYRQHQHGHTHPQGSYLDMSTRAVF